MLFRSVHVLIGAGHPIAARLTERGNAAHERAADAEDMNVHVRLPRARRLRRAVTRRSLRATTASGWDQGLWHSERGPHNLK